MTRSQLAGCAPKNVATLRAACAAWSSRTSYDVTRPSGPTARSSEHVRPAGLTRGMWIGWLEFDVLLGDVRSLKEKRSIIRPVVAELQRKFSVSAAETGSHDLYRRAGIGVATVSGDRGHAVDVLDAAERLVAAHPEFELLSVRRSVVRSEDLA